MKNRKVGIIGTGFSAVSQIEAIKRLNNVEIVAIAATSMEKAEQYAKKFGIPRWYEDAFALIEDPEVEIVHNCTPNHLHFPINKAALLAGKHILSEKPLAMNSVESAELCTLSRQSVGLSGVCFNYRHFPLVAQVKDAIRDLEYGKPILVTGGYYQDWLLYNTDYNWRLDNNGATRAIADIGSHWCDLLQFITGQIITEVCADLTTVHAQRMKPVETCGGEDGLQAVEMETEDCGSVLIRFDGGLRGVFTVSQVSAGRKNRLHFEVSTESATIAWDQEDPNKIWIGRRDTPNLELVRDASVLSANAAALAHYPGGHQEGWPDGLKNLICNFYETIAAKETGKPNEEQPQFATFDDGHRIMKLIEAIAESHRTGKWMKVADERE
jgi:predicted dehydrogenase